MARKTFCCRPATPVSSTWISFPNSRTRIIIFWPRRSSQLLSTGLHGTMTAVRRFERCQCNVTQICDASSYYGLEGVRNPIEGRIFDDAALADRNE
jgi:hypothetical protein